MTPTKTLTHSDKHVFDEVTFIDIREISIHYKNPSFFNREWAVLEVNRQYREQRARESLQYGYDWSLFCCWRPHSLIMRIYEWIVVCLCLCVGVQGCTHLCEKGTN